MKQVTATGQSVHQAVASALAQLHITEDQADISIIDQGKKAILGLFGGKPATVLVKKKQSVIEDVTEYLLDVTNKIGVFPDINVIQDGKTYYFQLSGEKLALIIGKRGQTLNALQYLAQLVANQASEQYVTVIVDAEKYRERRKETLYQLAGRLAQKSLATKKIVKLEPMPSYERKIIHAALSKIENVRTYSEGNEPNRYIVIAPNK
ncbi:RNA-binding cell elongation regulator Jag/EloR [Bacillus sp. 2205SS5-2]|uniref:RNA-binding cell elongation regulator Jag/EloR n=1 Tax=Bacillus sp. 2205SS5-2 TaxID=3109031 RepID=UPI003007AB8E